jgi:hypothetical protein
MEVAFCRVGVASVSDWGISACCNLATGDRDRVPDADFW